MIKTDNHGGHREHKVFNIFFFVFSVFFVVKNAFGEFRSQ